MLLRPLHAAVVSANFDGATFKNAVLDRVIFNNSSMKGVSFVNAVITGSEFEGVDLTGANFEGATVDARPRWRLRALRLTLLWHVRRAHRAGGHQAAVRQPDGEGRDALPGGLPQLKSERRFNGRLRDVLRRVGARAPAMRAGPCAPPFHGKQQPDVPLPAPCVRGAGSSAPFGNGASPRKPVGW